MKKAELITAIADKTNGTKADIEATLNALGLVVLENVKESNITIPNLGAFKLRTNKAKDGINMQTKEKVRYEQSYGVAFKQSAPAKKAINGK